MIENVKNNANSAADYDASNLTGDVENNENPATIHSMTLGSPSLAEDAKNNEKFLLSIPHLFEYVNH